MSPRDANPVTLKDRLAKWTDVVRKQASDLPPGPERDALLEKAQQAEAAAYLDERVGQPGQSAIDACGARPEASAYMRCAMVLSSAVAHSFVEDMRAFHAERDGIKADGIAERQLHSLRHHFDGELTLHDVRSLFRELKDYA